MKKLVFLSLVSVMILACNQNQPSVDSASKSNDGKKLYEKNLANVKAAIKAFENEDIDGWASYVADTAVYLSAAYGVLPGKKKDWIKTLTFYVTDWDSIKLRNSVFLPSMDTATHEFDGSVRYYGQWNGIHKSGVKTKVNFYAYYKLNDDNKIVFAADFYDAGGLMNVVAAKSK